MGVCHNCRSPRPPMPEGVTRPGKRSERQRLEREARKSLSAEAPKHLPIESRSSNTVTESIVGIDDVDSKDIAQ